MRALLIAALLTASGAHIAPDSCAAALETHPVAVDTLEVDELTTAHRATHRSASVACSSERRIGVRERDLVLAPGSAIAPRLSVRPAPQLRWRPRVERGDSDH